MTVQEALRSTQGRDAGRVNRTAANYAETLIQPDETVSAAVVANITAHKEHFPGVVVLTDQRVLAVCGLPGIKRAVSLRLDELAGCSETASFLNYKAVLFTKENGFTLIVNPEIGERFSRRLAALNGEEAEFDAVKDVGKRGILNPLLIRNAFRKRQTREKEKARRKAEQEAINARFAAGLKAKSGASEGTAKDARTAAGRLTRQLTQARKQGVVADTDPLAVAARLAEELAAESDGEQP